MKKYLCPTIVDTLTNAYHLHHFPEEFDYAYDSTSDAKDRRHGDNPMENDYIKHVNARRQSLGAPPLARNGLPTSEESLVISKSWAEQAGQVSEDELIKLIYHALFQNDPVDLGGERERYHEVATILSIKLIGGESFVDATTKVLGKAFGFPRLKNMHLSSLDGAFRADITKRFLK